MSLGPKVALDFASEPFRALLDAKGGLSPREKGRMMHSFDGDGRG
jgi:hypothetical protein